MVENWHIQVHANSNVAMDYCSGKYIKILHRDDFFVDNHALEKIVDAMDII
jgi:hypothetical protein